MNQRNQRLLLLVAIFSIFIGYRFFKKQKSIAGNVLLIGTNTEYPPFSFMKNDDVAGFDIDVAKEVARRLDKKAEFKIMSFDALIPEVQLGHVQLVAAGMTPTTERAKRVIFTKPHFKGTPLAMLTLAGKPSFKTLDDLKGKRVVVNQGYYSDTFMSPVEGIELIRVGGANVSEGILALQSDRADVYITSLASLKPLETEHKLDLYTIVPVEGEAEKIALIISRKYQDLEKPVQEALDAMQDDGTLEALETKWKLK